MLPATPAAVFAGAASIKAHKELNPPGLRCLQSKENNPLSAPITHICTAGRAPRRHRSPASRALETLPAFLGFSPRSYFFTKSSIKNPRQGKLLPSRPPQPCSCPAVPDGSPGIRRILVLKLLRKRVLKFKPRGAELSSSLSGQEPPSPFPNLRSKAASQHLSRSWSKPPGLWGAAGSAPPSSAAPAKILGSPRACGLLSEAFPGAAMLPSLPAHGSGPLGGCSASSPGGRQEGLGLWEGLLGPAAHTDRVTIPINPEQGEAAKTCLNTPKC